MGFEPVLVSVAAPATCPVALRARIRRCRLPVASPAIFNEGEEDKVRRLGRAIGLDVHLEFCEVAIAEDGVVRSAGRIQTTPEQLELFAQSLGADDWVALEVTGSAWEIARILEPQVARVVVVSPNDTGIRQARAKTDRLDARTLARLLWAGELDAVWTPDEQTRVLRRRLSRRGQLVRARSRAKNEVHAVLMRRLKGKPPFSDLFGVKARKWLAELELPVEEQETVAACLRHVEFLDREIAAVDALIAEQALESEGGAAVDDGAGRQRDLRPDVPGRGRRHQPLPDVAQAGRLPRARPARLPVRPAPPTKGGRISKQGSPQARWALVEAAWSVVQQPGPLHAFYERIRARRGHAIAVVAVARKLAVLFWCLLSRAEDYAHSSPR